MPARIVIVDDHEIVREGIRTLIARSRPEWNIVGEGSSGAEAIEICETLKPDVLVLDITMPGMSGLEAAVKIGKSELSCRVLMFTMHESERLAAEVRQAGAQGLVLKSQAARDLIRAIECLLAGGTFFGREPDPEKNTPTNLPPSGSATDQSIRDCRGPTPANRLVARIRSRPIRFVFIHPKHSRPSGSAMRIPVVSPCENERLSATCPEGCFLLVKGQTTNRLHRSTR